VMHLPLPKRLYIIKFGQNVEKAVTSDILSKKIDCQPQLWYFPLYGILYGICLIFPERVI